MCDDSASETQSLPYEARKLAAAAAGRSRQSRQSRHLHMNIIIAGIYVIHAVVVVSTWANYINRAIVSFHLFS